MTGAVGRQDFLQGFCLFSLSGLFFPRMGLGQSRPHRIFMLLARAESPFEKGFRDGLIAYALPTSLESRQIVPEEDLPTLLKEILYHHSPALLYVNDQALLKRLSDSFSQALTTAPESQPWFFPCLSIVPFSPQPVTALQGPHFCGVQQNVPFAQQLFYLRMIKPTTKLMMVTIPNHPYGAILAFQRQALRQGTLLLWETLPLDSAGDIDMPALASLLEHWQALGIESLFLPSPGYRAEEIAFLAELATEKGFALLAETPWLVQDHRAMLSVRHSRYAVGRYAAYQAQRILSYQQSPARLGLTAPRKPHILVNVRTVKRLGLQLPVALLQQAELWEG